MGFSALGLDKRLIEALDLVEVIEPTEIQKRSIPKIIAGLNVLGIAPTGTGKTFSYLLPAIHRLINAKIRHDDPSVLIIVPTRELVQQVQDQVKIITKKTEVFSTMVVAGERDNKQKRKFKELIEVIVATPGRLVQFIEDEVFTLSNISILIIDEVDRMLDMGFQAEIKRILIELPHKNKRQTLLFCSTLPLPVERIATMLQQKTNIVEVGRSHSPENIEHELYQLSKGAKFDKLLELLKSGRINSALIFTRAQGTARITTRNLLKAGLDCEEFHGGLTQRQRNKALQNFSSGQVRVLVATDIAARGIDIKGITHVINFDVPRNYDDYLHRAGRTGRLNKKGTSIILASPDDFHNLHGIKKNLGRRVQLKQAYLPDKKPASRSRRVFKKPQTIAKGRITSLPSSYRKPTKKIRKKPKSFRKKAKRK